MFAKARAAGSALSMRRRRQAVNSWLHFRDERARKSALLQRAAVAMRERGLRKGATTWVCWREERVASLALLEAGATFWRARGLAAAVRKWLAVAANGDLAKRAMKHMRHRGRAKAVRTWEAWLDEDARQKGLLRRALAGLSRRQQRRGFVGWRHGCETSALDRRLGTMRTFVQRTMAGGAAAVFTTLAAFVAERARARSMLRSAAEQWAGTGARRGWLKWKAVANGEVEGEVVVGVAPAGPSSFALRTMAWMRDRSARAHQQLVLAAGDGKAQCDRLLREPHAALVFRHDGALLRVVGVHKRSTSELCVVNLAQGSDDKALAIRGLPLSRLGPPEFPLVVPGFFGAALPLTDGLEVKVVEADFGDVSARARASRHRAVPAQHRTAPRRAAPHCPPTAPAPIGDLRSQLPPLPSPPPRHFRPPDCRREPAAARG